MKTETTPSEAGLLQRERRRANRDFAQMADSQLIQVYRATGDEWAFVEFYRRNYETVFLSSVKFLGRLGMEHGAAFVAGRTMETFRHACKQGRGDQSTLIRLAFRIARQFLKRHKLG